MPALCIASSSKLPTTSSIVIPDLFENSTFEVRVNQHQKAASSASKRWLFTTDCLSEKKRRAFHGLKAGLLTSMCYPDAAYPQLVVCCKFMQYLFHLDNLSDDMGDKSIASTADVVINSLHHPHTYNHPARVGKMTRSFYKQFIVTASSGAQRRFIETFDFFFQAVSEQARDRATNVIPSLERYIAMRRDTSGCKPCWALIEYANNLDIPDEVMEHPSILALGEATNDLVTWSNDIFSYNVEQSKGDTHNMIQILIHHHDFDVQSAVSLVGDLCKRSVKRFNHVRQRLPSWGRKIDKDVAVYVEGLEHWIHGSLHWSFMTERYFGTGGDLVKDSRIVELLPRRS